MYCMCFHTISPDQCDSQQAYPVHAEIDKYTILYSYPHTAWSRRKFVIIFTDALCRSRVEIKKKDCVCMPCGLQIPSIFSDLTRDFW